SADWSRTFPPELEKRIYAASGTWLQLRLRGASESLISDTSFVQPLVSGKWIHSFGNLSRVIARGALGATWVDDFSALPTSLRFFSGGDRTIRGYQYSIIGPTDPNDDVTGGKHLTEASLEYEYPIKENWSLALFYDVGDAFNDQPEYKAGVGVGLHWRSPIGPVRIDFGHGLNQPPGDNFRFHLTIGPDL
ncbi:MAG TPA: outer membrane protein assembly factor, partial [Gammaproteobacteria bacterium]|nr:outer membrane protein assembly factor [Gammaproteobacteria bacterium]